MSKAQARVKQEVETQQKRKAAKSGTKPAAPTRKPVKPTAADLEPDQADEQVQSYGTIDGNDADDLEKTQAAAARSAETAVADTAKVLRAKAADTKRAVYLSELGEHRSDDPLLQRLTPCPNRPEIADLSVNQSAGYELDGKIILFTRSA